MKFNRNGRYLATAGQDCVIRIWEAIPNRGSSSSTSLSNPTSPGATPPMTGSGTPLQPGSPRSQQAHAGGGGGVVTNMLGEGPLVGGTSSTGECLLCYCCFKYTALYVFYITSLLRQNFLR